MTVLVLNCGSSSLKYEVVDVAAAAHVASGVVERISEHGEALVRAVSELEDAGALADVTAVGHRVVMGGREFDRATVIDDRVVATIDALAELAPLHNPANLAGIRFARSRFADVPHVAVFDTAFFHGLPPAAATYALDRDIAATWAIRRYGAHGTSHRFVSGVAADFLGLDTRSLRQIVLHLGNGASASAIAGGAPVDTSMGFTPLEGLVMGTRTGDIDAAVVVHLLRHAGLSVDEIDDVLNHRSGLRGLAGTNDLRDVHRLVADGDAHARLALDVYVHRLRKYVGAYAAVLGGLDVLTFTAGAGEHDAALRAETCAGLGFLGIDVDAARNESPSRDARRISPDGAPVDVLVVPTDEELQIALETDAVLAG
ncbi:MAG TPA: acetate/propionate family kinase [Acidimicrobiales bacterium]|nr:acetate/propionate family kinase [Acidimicrobiales bacterium]